MLACSIFIVLPVKLYLSPGYWDIGACWHYSKCSISPISCFLLADFRSRLEADVRATLERTLHPGFVLRFGLHCLCILFEYSVSVWLAYSTGEIQLANMPSAILQASTQNQLLFNFDEENFYNLSKCDFWSILCRMISFCSLWLLCRIKVQFWSFRCTIQT